MYQCEIFNIICTTIICIISSLSVHGVEVQEEEVILTKIDAHRVMELERVGKCDYFSFLDILGMNANY